ncbi:MAG: M48 family metalloprotease [Nitrosomonadales bacterium]|nr:M48 family metalloprotease [Nitrosomonadales bacterium]
MRPSMFITLVALAALATPSYAGENWRERASAEETVTSSDISAEVAFGREIAAKILGKYKPYDNPALIKYVSLVGLTLARSTNRPELEYHFMVLDANDVNAYAAPGGYVFITRGALLLMKDESELAGALAHEIAHVTEKHVVKELKIKGADDSAISGLAQLVGGSSESARAAFSQVVDQGLEMIIKNGYKREDELQADKSAVTISALSGYNSIGLAKYLDRIGTIKEKAAEPPDSTHPTFTTRIAQINDVILKEGINTSELSTNKERFAATLKGLKKS